MKHGFFKYRLMNEIGDIDTSGGSVALDSSDSSNDYDSSESVISSASDIAKSLGLDPSKYGLDKETKSVAQDDNSQGSDESQENAGHENDEKSFLEMVNGLGAIHNENPLKVESKDELKSLIQMGKDYTLKTQSLSEERKAFESERVNTETELKAAIEEFNNHRTGFENQFKEMQQWTFTLQELQKSNPDLFSEIQEAYSGTVKHFQNPVLDQQFASMRAELDEVKKGLTSRENELIRNKFESEKQSMQATEQSLKELGINVDWEKVKGQWAKTGMSVSEVVGAMHFEQIAKAQASKAKVAATQQKTQAKSTGAGNKSRPGAKLPAIDPSLKGVERAQALLNQLRAG